MSYKNNDVKCNSFYKNLVELDNEKVTEKKFRRLNVSHAKFSEYDFIRLFLAYLKINDFVFINKDELRYDLYNLFQKNEYKELFQDIAVKHQIEGNFLDIEEALQNANLCGLLGSHGSNSKTIIFINEEESLSIIDCYVDEYKEKMSNLVLEFLNNKSNDKCQHEGKIKKLVINN